MEATRAYRMRELAAVPTNPITTRAQWKYNSVPRDDDVIAFPPVVCATSVVAMSTDRCDELGEISSVMSPYYFCCINRSTAHETVGYTLVTHYLWLWL